MDAMTGAMTGAVAARLTGAATTATSQSLALGSSQPGRGARAQTSLRERNPGSHGRRG